LKPSVTILLPIHNAQHRLEHHVAEILDVLPELTNRFELLIIDDGSTDDSFDVARHLSLKYPQVSALRHPLRLGLAHAVRNGLEQTEGDLVLVGDEQHGVRAEDLRRLWHSYTEQPAAEDQNQDQSSGSRIPAGRARWFEKMLAWKPHRRQTGTGTQVLDRAQWSKAEPAMEIARGIKRRLDERENVPARRAVVHPLYLEQRRRLADQPAVSGQSADRGAANRGPVDRRQTS
jgi:glycosyltransferase involved in cell wall biosynthesis